MSPDDHNEDIGIIPPPATVPVDAALLPWPGYDRLKPGEIIAVLDVLEAQVTATLETIAEVQAYEWAHTRNQDVIGTSADVNVGVGTWTSKWTSKWHGLFTDRWHGKLSDLPEGVGDPKG